VDWWIAERNGAGTPTVFLKKGLPICSLLLLWVRRWNLVFEAEEVLWLVEGDGQLILPVS